MQDQSGNHTTIIIGSKKNVGAAFVLALFFGPLGLLYASLAGGVIMLILGVIISIITLGFGVVFVWIACIVWAIVAANKHNQYIADQALYSHRRAAASAPVKDTASIAGELKQFKELLDMGAITQAEFDEKKAQLLGK